MSFTPYIHFQGNCREAMTRYAEIFGAKLNIITYNDAPEGQTVPRSDRVMHSDILTETGSLLMASDFPEGMEGAPQAAVTISRIVDTEPEGRDVFGQLSEGGTVIVDYGPTYWSQGFGMLKDRFGTHWMVMVATDG
ncbi:VOC family protein [Acuticoccus sediminis]|uniref:VOC family protein n=1 Tax=Acuticoccus sediminis TaxID=2184697 RepID=A0A8B2NVP5_9HYPH|nr:VOC family protein [Acuticoccus sediminis]RAI03433.1 VOC family protein [Acuticoccus sediminis]